MSELHAALVEALAELTVVEKGHVANAGSYSYSYADIADVVRLTRPVLASHGLAALTPVHEHAGGLACTVKLVHASGETLDLGPFPFPHGRDAQATGSMVTYHRRYALVAALGMATTDEDDDGARATPRAKPWGKPEAKQHLVVLAEGDKDLAAKAWVELELDQADSYEPDAIEQAFEQWVNGVDAE